jgi:hypothetical protein
VSPRSRSHAIGLGYIAIETSRSLLPRHSISFPRRKVSGTRVSKTDVPPLKPCLLSFKDGVPGTGVSETCPALRHSVHGIEVNVLHCALGGTAEAFQSAGSGLTRSPKTGGRAGRKSCSSSPKLLTLFPIGQLINAAPLKATPGTTRVNASGMKQPKKNDILMTYL